MKNTFAIVNQKGGVAKTTTAVNLAFELAELGKNILVVDLDPQASTTSSIFGNKEFDLSVYDLLLSKAPVEDIIHTSKEFKVDVLPSDITLSGVDLQISQLVGREKILQHKLVGLPYDLILIDTPPSLGLLTVNALTASDNIIITICPDYFSLKGIALLESTIETVKNNLDANIKVFGTIVTRYRERVITKDALKIIRDHFGDNVFTSMIPENIKIEEAHNVHLPVRKYDSNSKGAQSYRDLAKEFLKRWPEQKSTTPSSAKQREKAQV